MKVYNNIILVILDGWGHGQNPKVSAIAQANTPYINGLYEKYSHSNLLTYGEAVGLPHGQMGNSEVGHLNIGAGRVVYQELARINKAIQDKDLDKNTTLLAALDYAKKNNKKVHLMGLVSDGGVHSHIEHIKALCSICEDNGINETFIHAFMDGRDTSPTSGIEYLKDLQNHIKPLKTEIASVIGRYYAMDRDKRWERIKLAYDLLLEGKGTPTDDFLKSIQASYKEGVTDEFLMPLVGMKNEKPIATISKDDVVICFNFRTDRCRQITDVLTQNDREEAGMKTLPLHYVTMTRYDENFKEVNVLFLKDDLKNTLGEVLEGANKTQVRIAETEKYPHVTFFFSGGREAIFKGEKRIIAASPKVATYDLQPEMSAKEITTKIVSEIKENQPNFICLNYANADMVGHTGIFDAAIKAAEMVDNCLKQTLEVALEYNYAAIVIADHGNSDFMINEDGSPHTAHTLNPVPCIFVTSDEEDKRIVKDGKLGDIAPTILDLMGVDIPKEMDGEVLIKPKLRIM